MNCKNKFRDVILDPVKGTKKTRKTKIKIIEISKTIIMINFVVKTSLWYSILFKRSYSKLKEVNFSE